MITNFLTEVATNESGFLNTAIEIIKSYLPQLTVLISTPILVSSLISFVSKIIVAKIKSKTETKATSILTKNIVSKIELSIENTDKKIAELTDSVVTLLDSESIKNDAFRNAVLSTDSNSEVKAVYEKEVVINNTTETNIEQNKENDTTIEEPIQEKNETEEVKTYEKNKTNMDISLD